MPHGTEASSRLKETIARLARPRRPAPGATSPLDLAPGCAFGTGVAERLKALEQGLGEVKGRLSGIIVVIIGAVVADLILRLVT
ncbi:MAG TPA: hypothetical protein G4O03_03630 [Dehalococcoidia bacterium]|nr:hypothetical protein [Dehalococcoidia bacterium]